VIVTKVAARKQLAFFPHNFILCPRHSLAPAGSGGCYLKPKPQTVI
jgi:hypothetical protein